MNYIQLQRLTLDDVGNLIVDRLPLPPGVVYAPYQYAQVDGYVLVKWRRTLGEHETTGENLWQGDTPLATGGGELPLWTEAAPGSVQSATPHPDSNTVWSRVDSRVGLHGLPTAIAAGLRDPANLFDILDGSL